MLVVLLVLGAGILAVGVMLFRAMVLFPRAILLRGWKRALSGYKFSLILAVILGAYETGNLSGFSWNRMRYVSDREFIDHALAKAYPGIYRDLAALRADYPGYMPDVRYWGSWHRDISDSLGERALGFARYQVKLPDAVVTLDTDGKALNSWDCINGACAVEAPAHPVFGIVATVQRDALLDYEIVRNFRAYWADGRSEDVAKNGHCASAYSQADPPVTFVIDSPGAKPLEIQPRFGFYLVATRLVPLDDKTWVKGAYKAHRITREQFLAWRACGAEIKADWPDVFGAWWQR